jgi:protease-4
MKSITEFLKNFLIFIVILQILPPLFSSVKEQYHALIAPKTRVAVVPISGMISSSERYIKTIREFFKDPSIRALVLMINCSGGFAGSSQEIHHALRAFKLVYQKPIIAFVENICASGAYYVASAADSIVVTPSAFIGSIGVYIPQPHLNEFIAQFKAGYDVIKSGEYKTAGDPFLPQNPEHTAMLQSLTDDTYEQFVDDVASTRPYLTKARHKEWANGRIFTGRQAVSLNLADELGTRESVEQIIRKRVTIDGEIDWIKPRDERPLIARLFGRSTDDDSYLETLCTAAAQSLIAQTRSGALL